MFPTKPPPDQTHTQTRVLVHHQSSNVFIDHILLVVHSLQFHLHRTLQQIRHHLFGVSDQEILFAGKNISEDKAGDDNQVLASFDDHFRGKHPRPGALYELSDKNVIISAKSGSAEKLFIL